MKKNKKISKAEKLTMMRIHYSTWFSYIGFIEEAQILGSNKNISKDSIYKKGSVENVLNESYIFFKSGQSQIQFGISETIVKILCGDLNVDNPEIQSRYLEKYEIYSDGTAIKFD